MTFQIKKIINCDTHNTSRVLRGTFPTAAAATRAIKHLWRVEETRYDILSEHCYNIVDRHGRHVSFVYPRGPWQHTDDCPF